MAISSEQSFLIAKYTLITLTALTLIATFVGYGVVLHEVTHQEDMHEDEWNYWESWRGVIIAFMVIEDITTLVGLFGAIRENFRLTLSYGIVMTVLWFFNFSNSALIKANVFNYLMSVAVIIAAFYFARRLRQRRLLAIGLGRTIGAPQPVFVTPTPAVIQVSPSYIPNASGIHNYDNNLQSNSQYHLAPEPLSTPPPPYSNASRPRLEFKY